MFDKISTPRIDIYDNKTNEYYGRVTFAITPASERALLGMVNNASAPGSIVLQDVTFFPASSRYVPPGLFEKYSRNGIIRAEFRDKDSKLWMPVDIYVTLDAQAKGNLADDKYHFDVVEYSNIVIQNIRVLPQGGSPANPESGTK